VDIKAFDAYSLKSRYYPVVIVIAPICLIILSLVAGRWDLLKGIGITTVSTLGLAFVVEQLSRDWGKKKEPSLFQVWEGKPTTRILRHRDPFLNKITKERYHRKLQHLMEGIQIPTAKQEGEDPKTADLIYDSCVGLLQALTKDVKGFPLVFQENMNYGFRRNLWGMKPVGIIISTIGFVICSILAMWHFRANNDEWLVAAICGLICVVLLILWTFQFTPSWVKITADEYARQLLLACDSLQAHEQIGTK
jgi:hypothetical protein